MNFRLLLILLIVFSACQTGRIPCPKVKVDKLKKSSINKKMRHAERNTTASAAEITPYERPVSYSRQEVKPALEKIDVEEWDCPKPGVKRHLPKALKDNIKKNKKAYESHYKNKADSVETIRHTTLE